MSSETCDPVLVLSQVGDTVASSGEYPPAGCRTGIPDFAFRDDQNAARVVAAIEDQRDRT